MIVSSNQSKVTLYFPHSQNRVKHMLRALKRIFWAVIVRKTMFPSFPLNLENNVGIREVHVAAGVLIEASGYTGK